MFDPFARLAFAEEYAVSRASSLRVAMPPRPLQLDRPATRREASPHVIPQPLPKSVTDAELIARLALGEERALAELYDRHSAVA